MFYHQKETAYYNTAVERIAVEDCTVVVSYAELLDQSCVEFPHKHIDYEIYYCLEGETQIRVEDTVLSLSEGQMLFLRPGVLHNTIYSPEHQERLKRYFVFIFSISARGNMEESGLMWRAVQYLNVHPYKIVEDRFNARAVILRMLDEFQCQQAARRIAIRGLYMQFIVLSFRCLIPGMSNEAQPAMTEKNIAIEITKYMHANYSKDINIADIAEEFSVSARHINRLFENLFGVPFKRSLNFYRLNYAKNYLVDTDYSIEKIAELVGLPSSRVLSRLFYSEEGITAREWRARSCNKGKKSDK